MSVISYIIPTITRLYSFLTDIYMTISALSGIMPSQCTKVFLYPKMKEDIFMLQIEKQNIILVGPDGSITVPKKDEITSKLAMLYKGECEGLGPTRASKKYGYSKQRYFQLLTPCSQQGVLSLQSKKRGPKSNYRRTDEVVRQVIRHRFLDSDASVEIIAQKINQCHFPISTRSVERVIEQFGLQKKTIHLST